MISGIDNAKFISETVLKLSSKDFVRNNPAVNSIVILKIFEKVDNAYKVFINGDIFLTKLPINLKEGELLLGKVIQSNPLTIGLDNFGQLKIIDQLIVGDLIKKLGIKLSKTSVELVEKLIVGKKPLIKSKIEELINHCEGDITLSELQTGMIVNLLWSPNYDNRETYQEEVKAVKDIPFDKLCSEIFKSIIRLNNLNLSIEIYNKISECFILDINSESNDLLGFERSDRIEDLVLFIDDWTKKNEILSVECNELTYFNDRIIKYILQKSVYSMYDYHPDFIIVMNHKVLDLVLMSFERLKGSGGAEYYKTDINCGIEYEFSGSVNGYFAKTGFSGKVIAADIVTNEMNKYFFNQINHISKKLNTLLNVSVSFGLTNPGLSYQLKSDLLNFKA